MLSAHTPKHRVLGVPDRVLGVPHRVLGVVRGALRPTPRPLPRCPFLNGVEEVTRVTDGVEERYMEADRIIACNTFNRGGPATSLPLPLPLPLFLHRTPSPRGRAPPPTTAPCSPKPLVRMVPGALAPRMCVHAPTSPATA